MAERKLIEFWAFSKLLEKYIQKQNIKVSEVQNTVPVWQLCERIWSRKYSSFQR